MMRRTLKLLLAGGLAGLLLTGCAGTAAEPAWRVVCEEVIDSCAADFDIRYALCVRNDEVFAAYYDADHCLKVAKRDAAGAWSYVLLDERVDWDSHRYITLVADRNGTLHLSGNMHNHPLVYFRSDRPGDIGSLRRDTMTNLLENRVTYPEFLQTDDQLVFHYRNGGSGNGSTYFNRYDFERRAWEKLQTEPLFDGLGLSNSYFKGPVPGKDGRFHLIWCWRDTPDCSTNHGLYYAFSEDLQVWHTPGGFAKGLPITPEDDAFLVDDIRVKEGLINGGFGIGFDEEMRPIVGYHKYDEQDHTNLFTARFESGAWRIRRITDWAWKWNFSGYGSIPFELVIHEVWKKGADHCVAVSRLVPDAVSGDAEMKSCLVRYNETDGTVREEAYAGYPPELDREERRGLLIHKEFDCGDTRENDAVRYLLRYETRYPDRDKDQDRATAPSPLRLIRIER